MLTSLGGRHQWLVGGRGRWGEGIRRSRLGSEPDGVLELSTPSFPPHLAVIPPYRRQVIGHTKACIEDILASNPASLQDFMDQARGVHVGP